MRQNEIILGDCRETMRTLIAEGVKVQCIVTSPPYWGLRDYGVAGQLGLEPTLPEFMAKMVEVFELCRNLLADDGTLWLNMGDSYAANRGYQVASTLMNGDATNQAQAAGDRGSKVPDGLKPKDLVGQPWRLAFALQEAGWWLRQDLIWHKSNPMPESVRDRCTKAHEYLFLLTKSERYFFDSDAIKEDATGQMPGNRNPLKGAEKDEHRTRTGLHAYAEKARSARDSFRRDDSKRAEPIPGQTVGTHRSDRAESAWDVTKRNRRSVWTIATTAYHGAHFATFPEALVEPCVLAGSRPGDIVFDPFMGSGTVAQVASRLGRHYLGCELNPEYFALQRDRTRQPGLQLDTV